MTEVTIQYIVRLDVGGVNFI